MPLIPPDRPAAPVLAGVPGATADPGTGPVVDALVDGLLADAVPAHPVPPQGNGGPGTEPVPIGRARGLDAVAAHRDHRAAWYGDLLGPLRVPVSAVGDLAASLEPRDHGLRVTLVVPPGADPVAALAPARALLLDDDRVEPVGVELPLPADLPSVAEAARAGLAGLDVSVPAWFVLPPDPAWLPALDVLAEDGAESVALHLPAGADVAGAAAVLRRAVDLDLALSVTAGGLPVVTGDGGTGLLNLLAAVRAALNGADVAEVAAVLASTGQDPLTSGVRRISEADAAVVRAFLPLVTCPSVRDTVAGLEALGLIAPDAA